jgi:hypothetical protein
MNAAFPLFAAFSSLVDPTSDRTEFIFPPIRPSYSLDCTTKVTGGFVPLALHSSPTSRSQTPIVTRSPCKLGKLEQTGRSVSARLANQTLTFEAHSSDLIVRTFWGIFSLFNLNHKITAQIGSFDRCLLPRSLSSTFGSFSILI